jgi:transketolase
MLNPEAKLREDVFDAKEQAPTRDGFGKGLLELGEINPNVVACCADLAESTRVLPFKEKYPERC